jgi:hypothetical protein
MSGEPTPEQIAERRQRQADRFAGVQIVTAGDLVRDVMLVRDSAAAVYQEALGNMPRTFLDPKAPMSTVKIMAAHFARLMPQLRARGIVIRDPADFETNPAQFLIEVVAAVAYIDVVLMRQGTAEVRRLDPAAARPDQRFNVNTVKRYEAA